MARKFLVGIDLTKNELQNAVIQNLATAPSSPVAGQIYYNTSDNALYFYNGSAWVTPSSAQIAVGLLSARPTASAAGAGAFYYATDNNLLYESDATNWNQVSAFGAVTAQTSYGSSSGNGTSTNYARADHTHGTPALGTSTPTAISITASGAAGSAAVPSKEDHTHAGPGFAAVTSQTTYGASSANGTASTVARSDHSHGTPALSSNAASNITATSAANGTGTAPAKDDHVHGFTPSGFALSAFGTAAADVNLGTYKITNLGDPINDSDAANKLYVDNVAQGLNIHAPAVAGTTATLASITGGTVTYNNGSAGVGATLTLSVALTTLDGVTLATGDRLLIKNEATSANNGIYTINSAKTVLTRATDFDNSTEIGGGDFVFVSGGTVLNNTGWVCVDQATTVGTTPIIFDQFSGAGTYSAGNGLLLTGNVFSAVASTGISVSSGGIAIDTSVVVRKYAANVGDGTNTSYTITHNLGTKDVTVAVYDNSTPYGEVLCDVNHTSTTAVTLLFSVAPTSNQYRVVVQG